MLYLTINTKAQDIRTTTVASKSVAVLGRHIRFCNSDVDYAKTAAELVEHDLRDGLLEIHSCKQCKQPFIDKPDSKLSNCPDCTNLARAIAKVEGA